MRPSSPSSTTSATWRSAPSKAVRLVAAAPSLMRQAYSDLLRFESRLTQNFNSLQAARRRYQAVLLALAAAALACGRAAATATDQLLRYVLVGLLLVFATTIVLFFATGVYSERISRAYKFVPQANRSLRPFNLYLNTGRSSPLARWIGRAPKQRPAASSASAPLRRTPSLRSQLAPIPPPTSPRGELIFSPRVDSTFQTGYQRYRTQWLRARGRQGPGKA